LFPVRFPDGLNHDDIQALVAAFTGDAFSRNNKAGYLGGGITATSLQGKRRGGFIINPTLQAFSWKQVKGCPINCKF